MIGIHETSSESFRKLMGNGLSYEIPKFQRDYSWDTEQWDDLWQDIEALLAGSEPSHYMGYVVLQSDDGKNFKIIDGQQRLTTLSIMVLAVLKCLQDIANQEKDPSNNTKRIETLRNSYIGYLDPVTLVSRNKLRLNRNNDNFYRQILVPLSPIPLRGLNSSSRLMGKCFTWLYGRIKGRFQKGEELAEFVDTIVDKLYFTRITVRDELNAFKVFETLNARGVQLSSADLLKNYLFSIVDAGDPDNIEMQELELLWAGVIDKLGNERFPEFLRTYWNSKNKLVRKNELFKAIKSTITSKGEAFSLIRSLGSMADIYIALRIPEDELWKGNKEISRHIEELRLFQVRQPIPLLMAAYDLLPEALFCKVLKACSVVSFRYNIIGGLNPNEQERVYNETALRIAAESTFRNQWLQDVYPVDDSFVTEFTNRTFPNTTRNHKLVRYILAEIERYKYKADKDAFSEQISVEHILPEAPGEGWVIDDAVRERCTYRLGNLTLLEKKLNKDASTIPFDGKLKIYAKSTFAITRAIAEHYAQWDEGSISRRQRYLAEEAKQIWSLQVN